LKKTYRTPLALKLRGLRVQSNLTQQEAASALSVSRVSLSRYETSLAPSLSMLQKMASLYRVEVGTLAHLAVT
jgi:transcriptional regulator with XRE-family HTH domain